MSKKKENSKTTNTKNATPATPVSITKAQIAQKMKATLASINKKYSKNGTKIDFASNYYQITEGIPTGFVDVDAATGINGFPPFGVVEVYGPESAGKSYLAQHIVANRQKTDIRYCLYADLEGGLQLKNMANIGVNVDELVRLDFDIAETIFEQVKTFITSGTVSCVVIDSVAALHPKLEADADYEQALYASKARLLSRVMPELSQLADRHKVLIIFINQLRVKVGSYNSPEDTPGGKALRYFAQMRCEVKLWYDNSGKSPKTPTYITAANNQIIGQRVNVKFIKNKFGPPKTEGMFELYFAQMDIVRDIIFRAKKERIWFIRAGEHKYKREEGEPVSAMNEEDFIRELILNDCVPELATKLEVLGLERKTNLLPDQFEMSKLEEALEEQKEQIFESDEDNGFIVADTSQLNNGSIGLSYTEEK